MCIRDRRDAMAWYGKQLLWVWHPRTYHSRTGKMSSLMCYTLSVLHCVLLPIKLHLSNSLVFHGDRPFIPSWLATPGPVYIKRQVRTSKTDPLVDGLELLHANHHYVHVRYPTVGRRQKPRSTFRQRAQLLRPCQHQNIFQKKQRTCLLTHM